MSVHSNILCLVCINLHYTIFDQSLHCCLPVPPLPCAVAELLESQNWPPNSPAINPVDCSAWGALQQMVYHHRISDIDQLKCMLIDCCSVGPRGQSAAKKIDDGFQGKRCPR